MILPLSIMILGTLGGSLVTGLGLRVGAWALGRVAGTRPKCPPLAE